MKYRVWLSLLVGLGFRGVFCAAAITRGESALLYDSYAEEAKGDIRASISRMVIILGSEPDDYLVNYRLGWLFSLDKEYKNSIDHYLRAAKTAPNSLDPWLALSLLYLNIGDYQLAIKSSNEILVRDPKNYYGLLRLAAAEQALGMNSEALAATNKDLRSYPLDTLLLEKKGYLLKKLGKGKESVHVLKQLLLLSPTNAYAKSVLKKI